MAKAGDWLTYDRVEDMGDMVAAELAKALRSRGLRMSTEDTDGIEIVAIESDD